MNDRLETARRAGHNLMASVFEPPLSDRLDHIDKRLDAIEEQLDAMRRSTRGEVRLWTILAGVVILILIVLAK